MVIFKIVPKKERGLIAWVPLFTDDYILSRHFEGNIFRFSKHFFSAHILYIYLIMLMSSSVLF